MALCDLGCLGIRLLWIKHAFLGGGGGGGGKATGKGKKSSSFCLPKKKGIRCA